MPGSLASANEITVDVAHYLSVDFFRRYMIVRHRSYIDILPSAGMQLYCHIVARVPVCTFVANLCLVKSLNGTLNFQRK